MTTTQDPRIEKLAAIIEAYDVEGMMHKGAAIDAVKELIASPILTEIMAEREDEKLVEGLAKWHFEYSQSRCVNITHKFRFEEIDDKAKDEWREQARQALRQARGK